MSRSGYTDDCDEPHLANCWRGAVNSAIRGKRGQAMLKELRDALDALPEKRLVAGVLETKNPENKNEYCAFGALARAKNIDVSKVDPDDYEKVSQTFGVAEALAREVVYENDEREEVRWDATNAYYISETPEERWQRMRNWVEKQIIE